MFVLPTAPSMESKSTIELEFRTGEDLFKNYGIGIIRQVVDKSEYAAGVNET